jgi:hypothetical protein
VARVLGRIAAAASLQTAQVNGYPALVIRLDGEIDTVMAVRVDTRYAIQGSFRAWSGRPSCAAEPGVAGTLPRQAAARATDQAWAK